ncbi:ABC transporter ATP-binding protein [Marinobacter xestospongiae]|uniref:ABC transporter ATP-binding protein n=1 Tax=Marinobacter xestospongiae TaxID=994319 RepID=A0ABU3VW82_9GAMM|nr:ABC transporter ATP-binding protein [Marinobacter xestospongiae]MDV2078537.1 ABC transporter ATP-binding protein [Marinobacter xestospongiae]
MTLSAERLVLGYRGPASPRTIVPELSLSLSRGAIHCLVGPNGCGKSTLLKALAGVLTPLSGRVCLEGRELAQWGHRPLARRLALLPQNPEAPEDITVRQLVAHGRFPHQGLFGRSSAADRAAVADALALTGMAGLQNREFQALSGGERQRAWVALALAQQADYLLLDEPTTFLDIGHQLEVLSLLRQLNRDRGLTVAMVLHDLNQASEYADRLLVMDQGRLQADGRPAEVLTPALLRRVFGIEAAWVMQQHDGRRYPQMMARLPPQERATETGGADVFG